jgi:limonene-1,2-epoxide hydrolase
MSVRARAEEVAVADPIDVVQAFCDAMSKRDAEALREFLADGVVYQNTGMPGKEGVEDVLADLAGQFAMFPDTYEYRMVNIAGDGEVVLTERVDMINGFDGSVHGVPVMGTFVVRDAKITRWTDYFDTGLVGKMLSGEDYSGLVPAG